jgi:hypothetical protein
VPLYSFKLSHMLPLCLIGIGRASSPHLCGPALPAVQPDVAAAELGSEAPGGGPAQQGVGEAEPEAAVPSSFAGGDSSSDERKGNEEVCCFCPSLHFPH